MKNVLSILISLSTFYAISQPTAEQIKKVEDAKKEVKGMKGETFPDFDLQASDGTHYTKEELKGKVLLINFWFTSCTPCIQEIPELNEMVESFEGEDVVFLAPTFESSEKVESFLKRRDFIYETIADVKDFCLELNVRSYPTHFIVDKEGIIKKVHIGYSPLTAGALRRSLRKLLKSE